MNLKHWSALAVLFTLIGARPADADVVWLLSGDTLTGTTLTLESGVLTFRTPYAKDVKVQWKEVAGLETARQVRITVRRRGWHVARVSPGPEGYVRLQMSAGPSLDVPLHEVVTIVRPQSGVITTGRAETGFLVTSGPSNVSSLHLTGEMTWRTPLRLTAIDTAVNRAQNHGVEITRSITTTFRHRELLTDRVYANGNVIVTSDRFRDLALRTAPGLGIGYQFLEFGATSLSMDGGISYVNERHDVEADRNYWAARETMKLEHFLFPRRLQLFHQHDGYFGLAGDDNWFVRTRSGGRFNLTSGIIMTGELALNFDRRPPVGQDHLDRTFAITLGYQLGF
jgi:putative salt-induced outer membrane protein YdiY